MRFQLYLMLTVSLVVLWVVYAVTGKLVELVLAAIYTPLILGLAVSAWRLWR